MDSLFTLPDTFRLLNNEKYQPARPRKIGDGNIPAITR